MKKLTALCLALVTLFLLIACSGGNVHTAEAKTFSKDGMSITLTDAFREKSVDGYTVAYDSSQVGVLALKEPFEQIAGSESQSLQWYADIILQNNKDKVGENGRVQTTNKFAYFEYTAQSNGSDYTYLVTMFKGPDAFWMIQFFSKKDAYSDYRSHFMTWADSVTLG